MHTHAEIDPSTEAAPSVLERADWGLGAVAIASSLALASCAGTRPVAAPLPQSAPAEPAHSATPAAESDRSTPTDAPQPAAPAASTPADSTATSSFPIHGWLDSRLRVRTRAGEHDVDLYETLALDLGDAAKNSVTGHFQGRVSADLDGHASGGGSNVFTGLEDTYSQAVLAKIYEAYADVQHPGPLAALRVGRQIDFATPQFAHFDGARIESKPIGGSKVVLGAYGGVPVRLWESPKNDQIFGTWLEARPFAHTRARLDWMHLDDDQTLGVNHNDLLGASAWQDLGERVRLEGGYTRLENQDRDAHVRASYDDPKSTLSLQASYYRLLEPQSDLAIDVDPFTQFLQTYFPYSLTDFAASRAFGEHFDLQAGAAFRRVADSADEGPFNRDFDHEYLTGTLHGVLAPSLSIGLTGDHWHSADQDANTVGVDVSRELGAKTKASIGTYYSLYKFDVLLNQERDHVRTWYLDLRCKSSQALTFDFGYDFDDDGTNQYHTLKLEATWRF